MEIIQLHSLTYVSTATNPLSGNDLDDLLKRSRERNQTHNITGMLLYYDLSFMQAIEGSADDISRLYANISRDPRHFGVTRIIHEPIAQREFPDWSMAFRHGDDGVPGYSKFMDSTDSLTDHHTSLAKTLLSNFKKNIFSRHF